ncbi:hypothetical protein BDR06DRAFT_993908 [Suillus hirtellus]|nr:hypothetical protein BDR06DRAFT_993908 [Suillus hirtellus]
MATAKEGEWKYLMCARMSMLSCSPVTGCMITTESPLIELRRSIYGSRGILGCGTDAAVMRQNPKAPRGLLHSLLRPHCQFLMFLLFGRHTAFPMRFAELPQLSGVKLLIDNDTSVMAVSERLLHVLLVDEVELFNMWQFTLRTDCYDKLDTALVKPTRISNGETNLDIIHPNPNEISKAFGNRSLGC